MSNVRQLIEEYLAQVRTMQVATARDNVPWCWTVYYAYDKDWNLIWISKPGLRHSLEIEENPMVAGAIAYDHYPPDRAVRGLQFEGRARRMTNEEVKRLGPIYIKQMKFPPLLLKAIQAGLNPNKFYIIEPRRFVLFDRVNLPDTEKAEVVLRD